jgi:hypothetical protein
LTAEDLLDSYNSQAALVHSLQASVILRAKGSSQPGGAEQDSKPIPVELRFIAPAFLRMTGVVPFGARRAFDLWSDGRDFRLLAPEGNVMRFFMGPVDSPAPYAKPQVNVRPRAILEALHWIPAKLESPAPSARMKGDGSETIKVELNAATLPGREEANLEFDLRSGTVSRLEILDGTGNVVTGVYYSDWQRVPASAGSEAPVCFPKRILAVLALENQQAEMKFLSIQMNPPLMPPQLQLYPPRGSPVTRLPGPTRGNN